MSKPNVNLQLWMASNGWCYMELCICKNAFSGSTLFLWQLHWHTLSVFIFSIYILLNGDAQGSPSNISNTCNLLVPLMVIDWLKELIWSLAFFHRSLFLMNITFPLLASDFHQCPCVWFQKYLLVPWATYTPTPMPELFSNFYNSQCGLQIHPKQFSTTTNTFCKPKNP